ncbi:MAG: CRISPR-associated helicase Cas3' [Bacteroidales bacterium]|nr:CRISPR-associated helicase Cas3' [Bacteroidales bacterium]
MGDPEIISHIYHEESGKWHIQSNHDHCEGVADLAAGFASAFGMESWGRLLGLLHDRGKERPGFQCHIRRQSGFDTTAKSDDSSSHSLSGAIVSHRHRLDALYWLSNAIAGHHRGLYDIDELENLLTQPLPTGVDGNLPDTRLELPPVSPSASESSHMARMLFSCLIDADRLDTERFMSHERYALRGRYDDMRILKERLDRYRTKLAARPDSTLNRLRGEIQQMCDANGRLTPGFFSLTVPTGGGKTIASVIWAISHALQHGKHRIIIAIPFTSIIVQTAQTLRDIFGEDNVLEHHSAIDESRSDANKLACENWDAPIVVTTNVQLFESIFSNKPSKCRRLHSLCDSIVILDETQSLPLTFMQPIVDSMKSYARLFGTSFLFCTASLPVLEGEHKGMGQAAFVGIDKGAVRSIVDQDLNLHLKLRRADMQICRDPVSISDICGRLASHDRVLCIVNTRRRAFEVFKGLPDDGIPSYHLSRMMCPAHILDTIDEIKHILKDTSQPVRVISTQLIEAGVDIDFPVVYRQMAGLDSLLQAAGRCNREGLISTGAANVFVFDDDRPRGAIGFATDAMIRLLDTMPDADWFSPETMRHYYHMLYVNTPSFDERCIGALIADPRTCCYEQAADRFRLIDDKGVAVIVNYGRAPGLVAELRHYGPSRSLSRKLGRHCVTIQRHVLADLANAGLVEQPADGFYYIPLESQYNKVTGLLTDNQFLEETLMI